MGVGSGSGCSKGVSSTGSGCAGADNSGGVGIVGVDIGSESGAIATSGFCSGFGEIEIVGVGTGC